METLFDYVTVACFLVSAGAFFTLTNRNPRVLLHLLLSGVAFAVANQVGNSGYAMLAWVLTAAGVIYAAAVMWQDRA